MKTNGNRKTAASSTGTLEDGESAATANTHLLPSRGIDLYYGFLGANQPLISGVFLYEHNLYNSPTPTAAIGSLETGLNQGRGL
jgi:hypothetical protein